MSLELKAIDYSVLVNPATYAELFWGVNTINTVDMYR